MLSDHALPSDLFATASLWLMLLGLALFAALLVYIFRESMMASYYPPPLLNMDADLADPLFMSSFTLVRSTQVVDPATGRASVTTTQQQIIGCIQPASGMHVNMLPEGERSESTIDLVTKEPLIGANTGQQPDQVLYAGQLYKVQLIEPYLEWGQGYNVGTCTLVSVSGAAAALTDDATGNALTDDTNSSLLSEEP